MLNRIANAARKGGVDRLALEPVLGGEQTHGLRDEQGVSCRAAVERVDQLWRRRRPCQPDVRVDVGARQALESHPRQPAFAEQLTGRLYERVIGRCLGIAVRPQEHEPTVLDRAGQELEKQERRRVGRMQVVEDDQQRMIVGHRLEGRCDSVE